MRVLEAIVRGAMGTEDLSYVLLHGLFSSTEAIKYKKCISFLPLCQMPKALKSPFTNRYRKITC